MSRTKLPCAVWLGRVAAILIASWNAKLAGLILAVVVGLDLGFAHNTPFHFVDLSIAASPNLQLLHFH